MKNVTELIETSEEFILFQDDWAIVLCNENAATMGHLRIFPKEQVDSLDKLSSELSNHLFLIASKCATLLFEGMKCHGTNIVVKDGKDAQNEYDRVCIEALARFENDGLDMFWEPKPGDQNAIKQIGAQIKNAIVIGGSAPVEGVAIPKPVEVKDTDQAYWENHLRRQP